jgi:prepilin-type N-terminal cleavage/methylation domain-containing protein
VLLMDDAMKKNCYGRIAGRKVAGLTLLELITVVAILAILAGFLVPVVSQFGAQGRDTATKSTLTEVRNAIMGTAQNPGYLSDTGQLPGTIKDLFVKPSAIAAFNPATNTGWHGPYIINATGNYPRTDAYGNAGDPALFDVWGNPIVLQYPTTGATVAINNSFARLISAGPNGALETPTDYAGTPYPPSSTRGDDIVLFINHADSYP